MCFTLEGFTLAQLADVLNQRMDHLFTQGMSPGWHTGSPAHRKSAKFDRLKKLLIGPGFQIVGLGMVARRDGEKPGIDPISFSFNSMALGAIPLIGLSGFFCNWVWFLLPGLQPNFFDDLRWLGVTMFILSTSAEPE